MLAVGHTALAPWALETAALLQAREDAVLSHATAAALWGIAAADPADVHITILARHIRQPDGMQVFRVRHLDTHDVRIRHGLPVTAPARTLIDYAAAASDTATAVALNEARVLRLVNDADLQAAIMRAPLRSGSARIRRLLSSEAGPALTRSEAEARLRDLLAAAELAAPQFNVWVGGFLVDALWAGPRVVIEVDGFAVHGQRGKFDGDRRRDQALAARGYLVIRVSWRQLVEEPMALVARLAQALAARGG
ncbi:MAG: DUF559 domain-containing protein [Solirubrobacteraceae bacterium]